MAGGTRDGVVVVVVVGAAVGKVIGGRLNELVLVGCFLSSL